MIRLATVNDAQQILNIYAPYVKNTVISFEEDVPSREEMEVRIKCLNGNNPWVVLEKDHEILR